MVTQAGTTGLTVLFCGATGRLAALTALLLRCGHHVLATTRDPASPAARLAREAGAQPVRADFDDPASLRAAAAQADAIVAAGTAHAAGPAADTQHGRNIIDAARAARAGHLVYITVAGDSQPTGVPIIDSAFTVHVLQSRDVMLGQRIEIASDQLTADRAAAAISALLGRPVEVAEPPPAQVNPLSVWLEHTGPAVDITAQRHRYPRIGWHTFADWAAAQDWHRLLRPETLARLSWRRSAHRRGSGSRMGAAISVPSARAAAMRGMAGKPARQRNDLDHQRDTGARDHGNQQRPHRG
jgi:uncharacterized protein YbjT (DUF2867 family)